MQAVGGVELGVAGGEDLVGDGVPLLPALCDELVVEVRGCGGAQELVGELGLGGVDLATPEAHA